jgi:hypothetical protein
MSTSYMVFKTTTTAVYKIFFSPRSTSDIVISLRPGLILREAARTTTINPYIAPDLVILSLVRHINPYNAYYKCVGVRMQDKTYAIRDMLLISGSVFMHVLDSMAFIMGTHEV